VTGAPGACSLRTAESVEKPGEIAADPF